MFRSKKATLLLALMLVMSLLLTACGGQSDSNALVVAQGADPKSLDPHGTNDQPSTRIHEQIYDRLVETNEDMEIVPGLAESWEQDSEDPRVWTFKIREGVKFHNGEELTPEDVKFSLEREKASGEVGYIVSAIDTIEILEGNIVKVTTTEPFAPLLSHLSHKASSILNEKAVTEAGDDYQDKPVGTGAFELVANVPAEKVELKRYEGYWGDKAKVETLIFKPIVEGAQRTIGLETGEIDIAYDIEPVDVKLVKENEELELVQDKGLASAYVGFNTQKEPFTDPKVRQALSYAINVQDIIDSAIEGAGEVANGPINDKVFGYNKDLVPYGHDVEKAKTLLAEAGYKPEDLSLTVALNDDPGRIKMAESLQGQLSEIGIDLKIDMMEWAAYLESINRGDAEMFIMSWTTVTGDADYGLYPLFHSSQHGGAGNRTFYSNPEVDKLLDEGRTGTDPDARVKTYAEAQKIIVEDAPQIFLYFGNQNVGIRKGVSGFKLHPAGTHNLVGVSKGE